MKFNTSEYKAACIGKNKATYICARMGSKFARITEGSRLRNTAEFEPPAQSSEVDKVANQGRGVKSPTPHTTLQPWTPAADMHQASLHW